MDIKIINKSDGGDLVKLPRDLQVVFGLENMAYLALFGGNVEASTPVTRIESEQAFDFWGNYLLTPDQQFNSNTERTLNNVPLTSNGLVLIEQAIKQDLSFMKPFANISVSAAIVATDELKINVTLQKPDNLQEKQYIYLWDNTNLTIDTGPVTVSGNAEGNTGFFDYTFDFYFT